MSVMKKIVSLIPLLLALMVPSLLNAQEQQIIVRMDASSNGTVVQMDGGTVVVRDDDSQGAGAPNDGSPMAGIDYYVTFVGGCLEGARMRVVLTELSVSCIDTVYVYEGSGITGPLLTKFNSFTHNVEVGQSIYESPSNSTGMLTVRFRTDPRTDTNRTHLDCFRNNGGVGKGFVLTVSCNVPCESLTPVINDKFYRVRNGVVYDSGYVREVEIPDTVWNDEEDHSLGYSAIDTIRFMGAHLCIGDAVIFQGHGEYSYNYGYYTPSDETSYFTWNMDNEGDTIEGVGMSTISYAEYQRTGCFDLSLRMVDEYGCGADMFTSVKVRTSGNPIKTIFTLQDICNNDSLMVNMGYSGENATLTLRSIENDEMISKINDVRTFIPDGCGCGTASNPHSYYEAPVDFTEFPNGRTVTSAADICSVCINMEHSFLGDFHMSLVCPTGQEAVLKFGSRMAQNCDYPGDYPDANPSEPGGAPHVGGGIQLGIPLDGFNGIGDMEPKCDSLQNPFGLGMDYCFSRDEHYTLITGENAGAVWATNPHPAGEFYIGASAYTSIMTADLTATPSWIPSYFTNHGGQNPGSGSVNNVKHPSDHENKMDYYLPFTTFSELVGCPLNGTWKIRVYDTYGIDNGWVFNWSLDICNVTQSDDCRYQVDIDSLIWTPDPSPQYHDYDLGHYRGVEINAESPKVSYISSPDTAGTFPILVKVYDEFGCVWDTNTSITTIWTPEPNLGPDTSLCGVDRMLLDASDRHAATENYTYIWTPYGQNTDTITTAEGVESEMTYIVMVTNRRTRNCVRRDTIVVDHRRQPMPAFIPTPFSFEGCSPYTLSFDNRSVDAVEHLWVFGDGVTSSLASPTHTYAAGVYDLKYYATSADGCVDSIISPGAIAVYDAPQAGFSWAPVYPSVLNPVVNFNNLTEPKTAWTKYRWEIQYNPDEFPLSVTTLTNEQPTYDFSQWRPDEDPSGNYAVRLIARTDNLAPSGNMIYCPDTAENTILLVNDFLQFPNVVSPNGDGINDRFVIKNLVNGRGYPINQLDIYNKWGTRVFHKENISRDEDFWDPKDMPTGTYFYRFSAKGYNGNIEHNGAIEVVR